MDKAGSRYASFGEKSSKLSHFYLPNMISELGESKAKNKRRMWSKNKSHRRTSSEDLIPAGTVLSHIEKEPSIDNPREDFWKRHFETRSNVPWPEFRTSFLQDYGTLIREFSSNRVNWFLSLLHMEVFEGRECIYRTQYDRYCGKSHNNPDQLWEKIKQYATERIFREGVVESLMA